MIGWENSFHSLNQLEVNLNRLCVAYRIFPALYAGYIGVSINVGFVCCVGCLRYDSQRNNFVFGITTLRLASVAFSSYSALNAGDNIHNQNSLLWFLFFDPKRKAQANSLLELHEVHQNIENLFPFEDVLAQRNIWKVLTAAVIPWKLSSSKHSHLNLRQKTQWSGCIALFQSCCQVLRGQKFSGEEWYTRFQKKVLVCCQSSFTSWKKVSYLLKQC